MRRITMTSLLAIGSLVAPTSQATDVSRIVTDVMTDAYDHDRDEKNQCWRHAWKDEQGHQHSYCMRTGKPEIVGNTLYLRTFSVTNIGDRRYTYAHVEPGLMGAFRIHLEDDGKWAYQAREPGMPFGSSGDCGCAHASFAALGKQGPYGWMFTSGGTWSGVVVERLNIVTDIQGRITDVADLPVREEDAQDVVWRYRIMPGADIVDIYSLQAFTTIKGKPGKPTTIPFDLGVSHYVMPKIR